MEEFVEIRNMLIAIESIAKKNDEIVKLKGETFNLFNLLDRREDEVKTHSAFIAELLNPEGSHNQGNEFLWLFLEMLYDKKKDDQLWKDAELPSKDELTGVKVEKEKSIGKIIEDTGTGGRMDIYLSNSRMQICIENKIYASEQYIQLSRYNEYINRYKKHGNMLLYLTLKGDASKETEINQGKHYYTLSYKEDILKWLDNCFRVSVDLPILRESIKQYVILIKSLTNQLSSNTMKDETHKLILNHIRGSEIIANEFDNAIEYISNKLKDRIIERLSIVGIKASSKQSKEYSSIWIKIRNQENKFIGIESFNGKGHDDGALFIGITDFSRSKNDVKYKYYYWLDNTIEGIWSKERLFKKLQGFANGSANDQNEIADEIVLKIREYIDQHSIEVQ